MGSFQVTENGSVTKSSQNTSSLALSIEKSLVKNQMLQSPAYTCGWMLNVVTGPEAEASAVLIRGAEVVAGLETILDRRGASRPTPQLCAGPGKVAQALGLDRAQDGRFLLSSRGLRLREGRVPAALLAGPRVGIAFASEADRLRPWRFAEAGQAAVSRPRLPEEV